MTTDGDGRGDGGGAVISLTGVTKVFDQGTRQVHALDGISVEIAAGEFVAVMGPSGSGKSTLLHLTAGLDRPTCGEIHVVGVRLSELSDAQLTLFRRDRIGLIFQFFNLLPTLTAEENVALPLLLAGRRMKDVRERVEALLEGVGLAARRAHRPDELSGGEMQRVAIARAMAIGPKILLADEPTGNLDSVTSEEILKTLRSMGARGGPTIVMVTHDPRAASYGDRTLVLKDGRVVEARS